MTEENSPGEVDESSAPLADDAADAISTLEPSATELLEAHVNAYRQQVVARAAAKSAAIDATGIIDQEAMAEAIDEFLLDDESEIRSLANVTYERAVERESRVGLVADLYFILGIAISIGAVIYVLPRIFYVPIIRDAQYAFVGLYVGIVFIAASWFLQRREKRRRQTVLDVSIRSEPRQARIEFIAEWADLERALKRRHTAIFGPSKRGLRDIVRDLAERGVISKLEADLFLDALRIRNAVVHDPASIAHSDPRMEDAMNTIKVIKRSLA